MLIKNQKVLKQIQKAEQSGNYFITVTYRDGKKLKHWQLHSFDFYNNDLLPSLEQLKKLILKPWLIIHG